ncbi:MAG: DUF2312 domain-containing protein [Candidatus Puniceispirillaceae bacterium]
MTDKSIEERAAEWLENGDKGASSKCIYNFFMTGEVDSCAYPHDSADFGRCLVLVEAVPEWEKRLGELHVLDGVHGHVWQKLAIEWANLKKIYALDKKKCTQYMKTIIEPIEQASGEVADMGNGVKMSVGKSYKAGAGHNSGEAQDVGGVAGQRLKSFIERIERNEQEQADLKEDNKEIYAEAKGAGFDVKTIRKIVKLKKMDSEKLREEQELLELYASAIGMQGVLL